MRPLGSGRLIRVILWQGVSTIKLKCKNSQTLALHIDHIDDDCTVTACGMADDLEIDDMLIIENAYS